jgi:uncharacterized protein YuzE
MPEINAQNNDGAYKETKKTIRHTHDREIDAAYINLIDIPDGAATDTYICENLPEQVKGEIYLDFDKDGRLLGIEIQGADKTLPEGFNA